MDFLLVHSTHLFIMGLLVMLVSGVLAYFLPRLPYLLIMIVCGASGYLYAYYFNKMDLAAFVIFSNMIISLLSVGLGRLVHICIKSYRQIKIKTDDQQEITM